LEKGRRTSWSFLPVVRVVGVVGSTTVGKSGFDGGVRCGLLILHDNVAPLNRRIGSEVDRVLVDLSLVVRVDGSGGVDSRLLMCGRLNRGVIHGNVVRRRGLDRDVSVVSDRRSGARHWSYVQFEQHPSRFVSFAKRCVVVLGAGVRRRGLFLGQGSDFYVRHAGAQVGV
jgi:hypothetical protein